MDMPTTAVVTINLCIDMMLTINDRCMMIECLLTDDCVIIDRCVDSFQFDEIIW